MMSMFMVTASRKSRSDQGQVPLTARFAFTQKNGCAAWNWQQYGNCESQSDFVEQVRATAGISQLDKVSLHVAAHEVEIVVTLHDATLSEDRNLAGRRRTANRDRELRPACPPAEQARRYASR